MELVCGSGSDSVTLGRQRSGRMWIELLDFKFKGLESDTGRCLSDKSIDCIDGAVSARWCLLDDSDDSDDFFEDVVLLLLPLPLLDFDRLTTASVRLRAASDLWDTVLSLRIGSDRLWPKLAAAAVVAVEMPASDERTLAAPW